jgi:hypothetical protein
MAKRVDGGGGEVRLWRFVSIAPRQATVERLLLVLAYINFPFVRCPQNGANQRHKTIFRQFAQQNRLSTPQRRRKTHNHK